MLASVVLLLVMLLFCGLAVGTITVGLMLKLLLRPPRMTDGKAAYLLRRLSPDDLGLQYEDLTFFVRDGRAGRRLKIAAWWMPCPGASGRCAMLIHGYSDAKVGAIAWAPLFHGLGYHCFAMDLRAHGQSDGEYVTGGCFERHDVDQVLTQLRAQRPQDTQHLVLFGVSLGAAVALATAALRDDVAAVLCECPYADYRRAAMTHARLLGVPRGVMARLVLWLSQKLTGADYNQVRPPDLIRQLPCPVLVIRGTDDLLVEPADAAEVEAAVRTRSPGQGEYFAIDGAGHVLGMEVDPDRYRSRIAAFLSKVEGDLRPAPVSFGRHTDANQIPTGE